MRWVIGCARRTICVAVVIGVVGALGFTSAPVDASVRDAGGPGVTKSRKAAQAVLAELDTLSLDKVVAAAAAARLSESVSRTRRSSKYDVQLDNSVTYLLSVAHTLQRLRSELSQAIQAPQPDLVAVARMAREIDANRGALQGHALQVQYFISKQKAPDAPLGALDQVARAVKIPHQTPPDLTYLEHHPGKLSPDEIAQARLFIKPVGDLADQLSKLPLDQIQRLLGNGSGFEGPLLHIVGSSYAQAVTSVAALQSAIRVLRDYLKANPPDVVQIALFVRTIEGELMLWNAFANQVHALAQSNPDLQHSTLDALFTHATDAITVVQQRVAPLTLKPGSVSLGPDAGGPPAGTPGPGTGGPPTTTATTAPAAQPAGGPGGPGGPPAGTPAPGSGGPPTTAAPGAPPPK